MTEQQGEFRSPGGFVFGVQGWIYGQPRPTTITFFLDGTAGVYDQYGRPIKGTVVDNKRVLFASDPPKADVPLGERTPERKDLATHAQVIAALAVERVDWRTLTFAGWPQLPYDDLISLFKSGKLPPTPIEDLRSIKDRELRLDALKVRREADAERTKELQLAAEE